MIEFTWFQGARNTTPHLRTCSWTDLCSHFEEASRSPVDRAKKLDQLAYIPGTLMGRRCAANVEYLTFGSYDVDVPGSDPSYVSFREMEKRLDASGFAYILVTSTKSLMSDNRYRLILPFNQPVMARDHVEMWHHVNGAFDGIFDKSTHDPSRLSFFPARWFGLPLCANKQVDVGWPEPEAFQAFACNLSGKPYPVPAFSGEPISRSRAPASSGNPSRLLPALSPPLPETARKLLSECAATVPSKDSPGYRIATQPGNRLYCGHHEFGSFPGGRMFKFLCRTAARALSRKLPINADLLFDLARAVDAQNGGGHRPDLMREVERALACQAEHIASSRAG